MSNENKRVKMAAISGASHALKYKQQNPNASESEILQYISQDMDEILDKMDEELG